MKKKGFTLIELLAVIVIIAIIALIATPVVLNIIDSARKETFKNSSLSVFKAAELYETSNGFNEISIDGIDINDKSLSIENANFTSGKVIRNNNDQLELVNITDGVYCSKGTKNNLVVIKGSCDEFDMTAPINTNITIDNVTSNSFRVIASSEDLESGINSYSYSIDGINFITKNINNHIFNNLDLNKTYTVYVKVTNNNQITTDVVTKDITTNDIVVPTYNVDASGWQKEKIVTINYPEKELGFVYSYSIDNGDSWTVLDGETTTTNVTFTTNGSIIARVYDGTNYKTSSTYSVAQIDTETPTITLGTNGNATYLNQQGTTITISDNGAINHNSLKYIWTTSITEPEEIDFTNAFTNNGTINTESLITGSYYLWVMAKDEAGNKKVVVSNVFNIDITKPVVTLTGNNNITLYKGENYSELGATAIDSHSGLNGNVIITGTVNTSQIGTYTINYTISDKAGNTSDTIVRTVNVINNVFSYDYTGDYQIFTAPKTGSYEIELWGAQGGNFVTLLGGRGGYTKGTINLTSGTKLYIYIGGNPGSSETGGYNGGGTLTAGQSLFGAAGGGATDIRLVSGNWDSINSLISRIMVASGGGGANNRNFIEQSCGYGQGAGGYGGGLVGGPGETTNHTNTENCTHGWGTSTGGTQTSGGIYSAVNSVGVVTSTTVTGSFGSAVTTFFTQSGGGSGYYGGSSNGHGGAGGGSSFISGYPGCNAVSASSTSGNIIHTGQANHYSGYVFTNYQMIAGNAVMPLPSGGTQIGHTGNGYTRITYKP